MRPEENAPETTHKKSMQKPLTQHWADIAAQKIIADWGDRDTYTVASGITPSGTVHIGNFREVITVDLVRRALESLQKKVRFIYSWDDFDTFRKVPKNYTDAEQKMLEPYLRQPISRVPDPRGVYKSYAEANIRAFEQDLKKMGITPEFLYQEERYASGLYADRILEALKARATIRKILDAHRTEPLAESWLPTAIYCEKCGRDAMEYERYDDAKPTSYFYKCKICSFEGEANIRTTRNLKLNWRTDWPMRWNFESVDFEPGGKDHSSEGGSFDTGREIIQAVWGRKAPSYLQYDFVSIKGGTGKMSSSRGELFTLGDALSVYDPQMVRWLFANQRPNHDFSLAFDADVIKVYDEFDRAEAQSLAADADRGNSKWQNIRRSYELSLVEGPVPAVPPVRAPFRALCGRLQVCGNDIERVFSKFYAAEMSAAADKARFVARAECAVRWLSQWAPEEYRYSVRTMRAPTSAWNEQQNLALKNLRDLVGKPEFANFSSQDLNQRIYDDVIRASAVQPMDFFKAVYQTLIGRDQGPRLPQFLLEIGQEKLLELL